MEVAIDFANASALNFPFGSTPDLLTGYDLAYLRFYLYVPFMFWLIV